jgi:hypothetical protein
MKNIVSILAVVAATATSVSAATTITATGDLDKPKWNGSISVNAIPNHCEFVQNSVSDGSMDYNIGSGVWSTTSDATVTIKHRGASELTVTNAGVLERTDAAVEDMAVVVDYTGSGLGSNSDGVMSLADTTEISVGSLTAGSGIKSTVINIGGTAKMVDTDVETNGIENGGQYIIVHTVNCIQ